MISKEDIKHLENIFPFWNEIKQNDRAKIILSSRILSLKKNSVFFNSQDLDGLLFLKSGKLRFFLVSLEARELPLYFLNNMQIEFFENYKHISNRNFIELAFTAEKNSEILFIPNEVLDLFRKKYNVIEKFLHNLTIEKFSKSLLSLQNILLVPLKDRLVNFLYSLDKSEINLTHEEIAKSLGSSREVITRILKTLEKEKILKVSRKKIILINRGDYL